MFFSEVFQDLEFKNICLRNLAISTIHDFNSELSPFIQIYNKPFYISLFFMT